MSNANNVVKQKQKLNSHVKIAWDQFQEILEIINYAVFINGLIKLKCNQK